MTTLHFTVAIAINDQRPDVQARLAAELDDAVRFRFRDATITPIIADPVGDPS